jgi:hypothetical protein
VKAPNLYVALLVAAAAYPNKYASPLLVATP